MASGSNIGIVEEWCARVWGRQEAAAIDELFVPKGTASGIGKAALIGPPEYRAFHAAMCALVADPKLAVRDHIEAGDRLAAVATFSGTCRRTGKRVEAEGSMYFTFADGKIAACENHFEFMELFEQLGLLPEDSFVTAMGGGVICG